MSYSTPRREAMSSSRRLPQVANTSPGNAYRRFGYTPEQYLIVRVIAQAFEDVLSGLPDDVTVYGDKKPVGYWREDAAGYLAGPLFREHCEWLGINPDARNLSTIIRQIMAGLNMLQ